MKKALFIGIVLSALHGFTQPKLWRNGNSTLSNFNQSHPEWNKDSKLYKWKKSDTLKLPFFDEFISTKVYPDSNRWFNNLVYVNNDFPIHPPSYGVATFDDLDAKGRPYRELNDATYGSCDTLLSLAINLKDSSGKLYSMADSIYLSFYYQRQGNGDPSDQRDSLIVQFKDNSGNWRTTWRAKGGSVSPFTMVMLGVKDVRYLHKGFQFRFINFSRHTGNLNQWHIDYVHLASNRRRAVNYYKDFAVQSPPTSLLKNYYQMPYDHFMADASNQKADSIFFFASNLSNQVNNIKVRHTETHKGATLVSTNFDDNAANILDKNFANRRFPNFNFDNLSGSPVVIIRDYEVIDANNSSVNPANDKITVYQEFNSCYAYDDGTAEYGFGYDDEVVDAFYKGAIAYKFNLTKPDSLWAIGMFFNRSVKSTSTFKFDLKVWQKISPLASGRTADQPLLTLKDQVPHFTDSNNGYHVFYLEEAIQLPKGSFYIGWEQIGNFHLDVGYDINNGYHASETSDNLFWSDRGNWAAVNFKGALMMRPYVGVRQKLGPVNRIKSVNNPLIKCYPNPFIDNFTVANLNGNFKITVFDFTGKLVAESDSDQVDMSRNGAGIYNVKVVTQNGEIFHQKIVKLQ